MTVAHRGPLGLLDSPARRGIVDLLAEVAAADPAAGLTAAELGSRLGVHPTTARFHLDQLVGGGLVESRFVKAGVGRPRKVYRTPTRTLPTGGDGPMRHLTRLLTETWPGGHSDDKPGGLTPEQAGRRWAVRHVAPTEGSPGPQARSAGAWLGKVGLAVDALHEWGYQPDVRTEDAGRTAELTLVDCPFMTLAKARPDVVCGVHRGLLRGTLEALGEPDTEVGLQPFVEPRVCLARVSTRAEFDQPNGIRHDDDVAAT
jgi:predicted ArsR family transcriptional regulator